jgi:hypothetical protein
MVLRYRLLLALEKEKQLHFPNSKDINGKLSILGGLPKNRNPIRETGEINAELFCEIFIFCPPLFLFYSSCIFVCKNIGSSRENDNEG